MFARWMTCQCLLDFNTMAGADKFGNVFVVGWLGQNLDTTCADIELALL